MFAAKIRKNRVAHMRGYPQWRWHLDELFVKVNGKLCYLWRAVDHEGEGHCQSKFYTACSRILAGWSSTVFAHESPTRSTGFDAENGLYLFALTVPFHCLQKLSPTRRRALIIDCHGHYTTAPKALEAWRNQQIAGIKDPSVMPKVADLKISDDELRETIEANQLRLMKERDADLTIFSPRASFMAHHIGDFAISSTWAAICNELCYRVAKLFPDNFIGAAMLPQSPGVDPKTCIPELERCVKEFGFVGINLNPDPSGGWWTSPPLTDKHWYPIYEKMVEYDIPAMVHVSTSCNPCFHTTGAHYINADTTAVMQLIQGDLFKDFPTLRFVIPHGGGAAPYHWGRYRGLAQELKKPLLRDHLLRNVFFDTCVYHQPGIDLLTKVIPVENVLFASEMIGAVRGFDPETGHNYDDTKRYIEAAKLTPDERHRIFEGNARRVYPRLDKALKTQGR